VFYGQYFSDDGDQLEMFSAATAYDFPEERVLEVKWQPQVA
jgi:hypothetical protein